MPLAAKESQDLEAENIENGRSRRIFHKFLRASVKELVKMKKLLEENEIIKIFVED